MTETSHHTQESSKLAIAMEQQVDQTSELYQEDHFSEAKFLPALLAMLPSATAAVSSLATGALAGVGGLIAQKAIGGLMSEDDNLTKEIEEIKQSTGSITDSDAIVTALSKLIEVRKPTDANGNMAAAFSNKDTEEWSKAIAEIKEDPLDVIAGALSVDGTMEALFSLSKIVPLYQLKEVIHAYRNAEDFGRMLKRRPSYMQLEQIRRLADVHPEDLQDLIDEFRDYRASYRGHSNRFLKSRVMIGELMGALRGDHPSRYRRNRQTSSDSRRELMRLAFLEENQQEREAPRYHHRATKRRMAYERIPFKHIPQVQLKLLETKNVLLNGRPQLLYSLVHDIAFPIELKTPRPIGSAFLRLQIKSAISERVVLQKSYRLKNIKNGILPTIPKFTKEELRDVEPDQDYMLSVRLLWKNRRGEMYGTALVVPISLMKTFLFDSIKEGGELIPFDLTKSV